MSGKRSETIERTERVFQAYSGALDGATDHISKNLYLQWHEQESYAFAMGDLVEFDRAATAGVLARVYLYVVFRYCRWLVRAHGYAGGKQHRTCPQATALFLLRTAQELP